ncbi:MAG: Spy/CpxP family protein refolding chaperone [Thermoanaerobaculia bacterium]
MKKVLTAIGVAALGATVAFGAQVGGAWGGQHEMGRHHMGQRQGEMGLAKKLNLSDAQKTQLRELHKTFREQNKELFRTSRQTQTQYRDALVAGDQATVDALRPKLDSLRDQMILARNQQRQAMLNILTPEQRQQFQEMRQQMQARRAARQEKGAPQQ